MWRTLKWGKKMERFMELYQMIYQDLYRLAYYYMGNAQDAEDAVQDAVLSAYEHFHQLKKEASFRPWIFCILVNHCKKMLKKQSHKEFSVENPQDILPAKHNELNSQAELLELLKTLEAEERLIVTLMVFEGYKSLEIAQMLHRNHSTIRSKYRRALQKLKKELLKEPSSIKPRERKDPHERI